MLATLPTSLRTIAQNTIIVQDNSSCTRVDVEICQFIESMQLQYDKEAREAGVYIVSACGHDSVPSDMGIVFLEQNFKGTLNSVESYQSFEIPAEYVRDVFIHGCINYATWESLVHSLAHRDEQAPLRKKLYPERLPTFKPKLPNRSIIYKHNDGWCVPFLSADRSIVYRTQRTLYETQNKRPVQFRAYLHFTSLLYVMLLAFFGGIILLMTKSSFTKKLLLDYPRIFSCGFISKRGPKKEVCQNTRFTLEMVGRGWAARKDIDSTPPDTTLVAKVSALAPSYGFSAAALLLCAHTILTEKDNMPQPGGVLTTGSAFYNTTLIKKLQDNNITFEIIEKKE